MALRWRHLLVVVGSVLASAPALASEGAGTDAWYYKWSCTGRCAQAQVADTGYVGPFDTEVECNAKRNSDRRALVYTGPGIFSELGFCERLTAKRVRGQRPASSKPREPIRGRLKLAVAATPGWRFERPSGESTTSAASLGGEVGVRVGRRVAAFEIIWGAHRTTVDGSFGAGVDESLWVMPLMVGVDVTPYSFARSDRFEVEADVAFDAGLVFPLGCLDDCAADLGSGYGVRARAGLSFYFGAQRRRGISVDLVVPYYSINEVQATSDADKVELGAPRFAIQIAYTWRNYER